MRAGLTCFLLLALALPSAADPVYDARGVNPHRPGFQGLSFERVDPMTGNVMLSFTDVQLPGNAGLDLIVQRTYNSKIHRDLFTGAINNDSWAGTGWTLQMGKVVNGELSDTGPVVIELSDGAEHLAYPHLAPPAGCTSCYVTKLHWLYDKATNRLTLPNGRRYTFLRIGTHPPSTKTVRYATEIRDLFNNTIAVSYHATPVDAISSITLNPGSAEARVVTFTLLSGKLNSMMANGKEWRYQVVSSGTTFDLRTVTPPAGPAWQFEYWQELIKVTTPYGAIIDYQYITSPFAIGSSRVTSRALERRTISGRDMATGTWTFSYGTVAVGNETVVADRTTVFSPCDYPLTPAECRVETYQFNAVGPYATAAPWTVGLLRKYEVRNALGQIFETHDLQWRQSAALSNTGETIGSLTATQIFAPRLQEVLVRRNMAFGVPKTWRTTHTYRPSNYEDFGRPWTTTEVGERTRTTTYTYDYSNLTGTVYLIDRPLNETVVVGSETFTKSWVHAAGTGFLLTETVYGVVTQFLPTSTGNLARRTDARGSQTDYTYQYGAEKTATVSRSGIPSYAVSRIINWEGTVAEETQRSYTTRFQYDALNRLKQTSPPFNLPTTTNYDLNDGSFYSETQRGGTTSRSYVDGVGRPIRSVNGVGVQQTTTYDVYGRVAATGYPFASGGAGAVTGDTWTFDVLDRPTLVTHGDGKSESWVYDDVAHRVTHRDERNQPTERTYASFGDPNDRVLSTIKDANNVTTTYAYNALGRLLSASGAASKSRTWEYNSKNQLWRETHPESGTTTYLLDAVGNVDTATDADGTIVAYTYDASNRVKTRQSAGMLDSFDYDLSGNKTRIESGGALITQQFNHANQPYVRNHSVRGRTEQLFYGFDGNDRLWWIQYPSNTNAATGTVVAYEYDNADRVSTVRQLDPATWATRSLLASNVTWHPSGQLASFLGADNRLQAVFYDDRHRPRAFGSSGPNQDVNALLWYLEWARDDAGNVTGVTDSVTGALNQTIAYDNLNRLTTVSGAAGSYTYGYDAANNRTSRTASSQSVTFAVDAATNRLTSVSGGGAVPESYAYLLNGNLRRRLQGVANIETTFTYNALNMLERVSVPSANRTSVYAYDADSLRVEREVDGFRGRYVHGSDGALLSEFNMTGGVRRWRYDYVYLQGRLLAKIGCAVTPLVGRILIGAGGGAITVPVTTPDGCAWTPAATGGITISPAEIVGAGSGPHSATVAATVPAGGAADLTVSIGPQVVQVRRGATACFAEVSPASFFAPAGVASDRYIDVNAPAGCSWTASVIGTQPAGTWIRVVTGSGSGPGRVRYVVDPNASTTRRTATVSVGGAAAQGWGSPAAHAVEQEASCGLSVPPQGPWLTSAAGVTSFTVTATGSNCNWSVVSVSPPLPQSNWLTPAPGEPLSGTTTRTVQLAVAANPSTAPRTAVLTLTGGLTHTIWQAGVSAPYLGIDVPAANAILPVATFRLAGFAADIAAPPQLGSGVAAMAVLANGVWSTPVMHQPHVLAGQLGGPQFANAGYYVDLNLPPGTHTIVVYMESSVTHQYTSLSRVVTINRPPSVVIPAPSNPYVINAGTSATLVVNAADPDPGDAVSRVEWYSNGAFIGQSTTSPFGLPFSNAPAGTFVLRARAFDTRGFSTDSATVTLIVNAPPTVSLAMPAVQSRNAPVFQATTGDPDGPNGQATRVDYYFGSLWLGASTAGNPFTWQYPGVAPPGSFSITALATDSRGLQAWSAPFTLTLY